MTTRKPLHVGPTKKSSKDDCGCGKRVKVSERTKVKK